VDGRPAYVCAIDELKESDDQGNEEMHMIREADSAVAQRGRGGQRQFINSLFGIAAWITPR